MTIPKKDIYEQLLDNKIQSIVSDITNMEHNLRCCGNCIHFTELNTCKLSIEGAHFFRVCPSWSCDRLTSKERMILAL